MRPIAATGIVINPSNLVPNVKGQCCQSHTRNCWVYKNAVSEY